MNGLSTTFLRNPTTHTMKRLIILTSVFSTVATVFTDVSDHRQHLLSRERGGSKAVTCAAVIRFTACQRRFAARVRHCGFVLWRICSVQAGHSLIEGPQ